MSYFDHTERGDDKADWMIVWFPQFFLACCLLPILVFVALAVIL